MGQRTAARKRERSPPLQSHPLPQPRSRVKRKNPLQTLPRTPRKPKRVRRSPTGLSDDSESFNEPERGTSAPLTQLEKPLQVDPPANPLQRVLHAGIVPWNRIIYQTPPTLPNPLGDPPSHPAHRHVTLLLHPSNHPTLLRKRESTPHHKTSQPQPHFSSHHLY